MAGSQTVEAGDPGGKMRRSLPIMRGCPSPLMERLRYTACCGILNQALLHTTAPRDHECYIVTSAHSSNEDKQEYTSTDILIFWRNLDFSACTEYSSPVFQLIMIKYLVNMFLGIL